MKKTFSALSLVAILSMSALAVELNTIHITGYIPGGAIVAFGDDIADDIIEGEMYFQGWEDDLGDLTQWAGTDRYIFTKSNIPSGINMTIDDLYYYDGAMRSANGGVIPMTYYFDGYDEAHVWQLGEPKVLTTGISDGENSGHFFSFNVDDISGQPPGDYEVTLNTVISVN